MKLVNMKMDPAEQKEKYAESVVSSEQPMYPWGLTINLDEEAIAKLGLDLPVVGSQLSLQALVDVTEVSSRQELENGTPKECRRVCLQITDLGLGPVEKATAADKKLYGG